MLTLGIDCGTRRHSLAMTPHTRETGGVVNMVQFMLLLLVVCLFAPLHANAQQNKPNIVVLLADNLGYGELGVYGGGILRGAPTPRIDTLAGEGMRLLNFNVEAQCTPSRSALMTGRFSIRSGT